ncbi:sensor protein PhoQ [Salmonella enterica subsp. enterica serovar Manhattan str. CFSAN001078]|nr:two-component system sensor histidine kinase PhoQ [Salmonella enterica]ESJ62643.1 sensor protein PhoQ [Salmonella enterica subsp. enterica serovar Manhattan str. CFSAN001078]
MNKFARHFLPLSLRVRFLLATAGVVLVLSLAYGIVALVGYSVSFDKTTFRLLRGESNLFYTLAKWENNKISVELPENLDMQSPTMTLIYDETGKLLWTQRNIPWLIKSIQPEWLKTNGFHEIETNVDATSTLLSEDHSAQEKLKEVREDDDDAEMTHSVAVNIYPATARMPQLTIVVVDTIPIELKRSYMVWSWFVYVLAANLLLVIPLLWIAAWWSLRPIEALAREVRELEDHHREMLNPETTRELTSLVRNLNQLLKSERERYNKYRTTLTDLTHSLKTPLAVLQSTLRSLRNEKMSVSKAEPVMLEQISRISQQIGYYLHRASMRGSGVLLSRELHPVAPLLDNLISALNKVYQRKGVNISMDISPEISFVGEQNDFVEVMGNVLDNACKYCLEFVEISARQTDALRMVQLEEFAQRKPHQLSGGQQQRVAIARAVVNKPRLLLLDESLSALDYKLRKQMQNELKALQRKLGITFVFVTHDQEEALTMSDRIVVMRNGVIEQDGTPREIYEEPKNLFVAGFIGEINRFDATVIERLDEQRVRASVEGRECNIYVNFAVEPGQKLNVLLRPEDLRVEEINDDNHIEGLIGYVRERNYKGMTLESVVELENGKMVMVSEFFNEDDPDFDHSLDQKMAISWVESWEVVLADEEHK